MRLNQTILFLVSVYLVVALSAHAESTQRLNRQESQPQSNQPYIDLLKREIENEDQKENSLPKSDNLQPFIDSVKNQLEKSEKLGPQSQSIQPYIDSLNLEKQNESQSSQQESYTEKEKTKLKPQAEGGAIQAVLEGRSELKAKKAGTIHHAIGFQYGLTLSRKYSADPSIQARTFNDVYGQNYSPALNIFYEFQPFHSEWFGNIGIFGMGGLAYNSGYGQFALPIPNGRGGYFPTLSQTKFQFFTIPFVIGANYRFNLLRILRPHLFVGPTAIGLIETRSDNISGYKDISYGIYTNLGLAISLDWASEAWDLYASFGVKHYYLTIDYTKVTPLASPVNIDISGFLIGLTFEY